MHLTAEHKLADITFFKTSKTTLLKQATTWEGRRRNGASNNEDRGTSMDDGEVTTMESTKKKTNTRRGRRASSGEEDGRRSLAMKHTPPEKGYERRCGIVARAAPLRAREPSSSLASAQINELISPCLKFKLVV